MEKDNSVKLGSTKCDFCNAEATDDYGGYILCQHHYEQESGVKSSSDSKFVPLKAAPIHLADQHKQK